MQEEMRDKVTGNMLEQMEESLNRLQSIAVTNQENGKQKLLVLTDELEAMKHDLINKIEEVDKKVEELAEEGGSYDDEDEESDQDLDSELGDTLDVNDMKYPNIDKDKSSDDLPQNPPAVNIAASQRLPSQASEKYEHTMGSYTEDAS